MHGFHLLFTPMHLQVASNTKHTPNYSYGWQRAEILGALVNGVFLLALCFTILIDSIERFVSPEDIKSPVLVLIVGSVGLVANVLGLFLFHGKIPSLGNLNPLLI